MNQRSELCLDQYDQLNEKVAAHLINKVDIGDDDRHIIIDEKGKDKQKVIYDKGSISVRKL